MTAQYNSWLVLTSVLVAIVASYTALDLTSRMPSAKGGAARLWLAGGAFAMGTGIWSMHFIGMLALSLPIPLGYDLPTTLLSMVTAIVASGIGLYIARSTTPSWHTLTIAATFMGVGICSMHYIGMHAMLLSPPITYDFLLVAASFVIAVLAANAALWIAYRLRQKGRYSRYAKIGSATAMGLAIAGMHYTGMAAAHFAPDAVCLTGALINTNWLAGAVAIVTLFILSSTLVLSILDAQTDTRTELMLNSLAIANDENRAKDEFLAILGHELRNPLAAISNASYILKNADSNSERWAFAREVIERQSINLKRLVDDLLDVGRVISGKIVLDMRPIDLDRCAHEALEAIRAAGTTDKHDLRYSGVPAWIKGDRTRVEQIITNFVNNAATYTPEHGSIRVSVMRRGRKVLLAVSDTGIGLTPEIAARIFEPFYQAKPDGRDVQRSKGGMGIGLALVHHLAQLHGAEVRVYSAGPGKGTTFTVVFPLHRPSDELAAVMSASVAAPPSVPTPQAERSS
jgi:NO-binding membrane sensor protein with MHYT domain